MTTKQIRIDAEVREALAERARGFETPNLVLRRILKLDAPKQVRRQETE
jgi:hypothetical protein